MVSTLHRYVYRELGKSFLMGFLVITSVMLLGAVFQRLRLGLGFGQLGRLLPYMVPYLLVWTVPGAVLASCVMTYGRLSADNELAATSVSGIPLRYMCYPALVMATALTVATVPLNNWAIPICRATIHRTLKEIFLERPFEMSILRGHETIELGDHKIYVESVEGDVLHNVVVIAPRQPKRTKADEKDRDRHVFAEQNPEVYVYRARRARYAADPENHIIRIVLEDAEYTIVTPDRNARSWLKLTADEQALEIPMEDPIDELRERRRSYLSRRELLRRVAEVRARLAETASRDERKDLRSRLARTLTELRRREALSGATLALALVGVPLGVWIRRESRLASFAIAVLVFVVLYALIAGSEGLALRQRVSPAVALWTPDALTAGFGVSMLLHLFRR